MDEDAGYYTTPSASLTVEQEKSAALLRAFGLKPEGAETLAAAHDPAKVRGAVARAKRRGFGPGWVYRCLKEGWEVDRDPEARPEQTTGHLTLKFFTHNCSQERFDYWVSQGIPCVWATEEEESMYWFDEPKLLKKPHEVTFGRKIAEDE